MSAVYRSALTVSFSLAALFASPLASAQDSVPGLKGLQGLNQHDAGRKLSASGYVRQSGSGDYGSWWNAREHRCVMVHSDRGHVQTAVPTPAPDCGQSEGNKREGMSDGAKTAVAAAAILGIAALAHHAHQHEDGKHKDDARREAEYERGYRDALHGYRADADSGAYSDGYGAGLRERSAQVPWRSRSDGGGKVRVDDLVGARAAGADSELRARGFIDRDAQQRDGRSVVTWWNERTRECIHVATGNGRIQSIRGVEASNCL
ncbi:hypothetical protein [Xanthomonas campestris]|uniref:hypothetical protein n=1 Tax=Xanthomonas campestris TaxID=339 RepID=UPI0011157944|nr:hypothetical protein [Xanthomonas campestris]MCF8826468.1 hypothetical protein [Xanthomonas campestris pv. raphani]MEA9838949.1 hypothetical protein [Xanthomonas campestris pv. raphani]MEA9878461.1 hypothetical protein [Xanthomonas campestris pv. raphani]MEA9894896.1 hypothetical protein [Xanthomonas campestris pv. raphani]MEA9934522.1 hypothetical protein [Xanthomonas campestris pv. raphani]